VIVVGLSAFFHESACCLLADGRLVAAAAEERFSRVKHDAGLPLRAFRYVLDAAGASLQDIDVIAYYEQPTRKLARQLWSRHRDRRDYHWLDAGMPDVQIREILGFDGPIDKFEHHESHAASAFLFSGFPRAAILTADGVGEWATTTFAHGHDATLEVVDEIVFPHSLGLFYSAITSFLGFGVNDGEYKVMGLAPYGQPRFLDRLRRVLQVGERGQYTLDLRYFDFVRGSRMYSDGLADLLELPPRAPETGIEQVHKDLARSVQVALEDALMEQIRHLRTVVDADDLCLAGGVALNCVANGRIRREGPFRRLYVQPAAGDAGGSLGAAALAWARRTRRPPEPMDHACVGPGYSPDDVSAIIASVGLPARDYRGDTAALLRDVAQRLASGQVVGWFQGRMEFGPRALGARSILGDPRDPGMRDRLNAMVKKRESFRPFAPSILEEHAAGHMDLQGPSPFMLETCQVRSPLALPAITHVDGSCRPQTVSSRTLPRFAALLRAFHDLTGCPLLVNTSFNVRDEPIVCSPVDAVRCFAASDIDVLVLEDFLIDRRLVQGEILRTIVDTTARVADSALPTVYTFF
jgi:carbamoyltransferase